jgi:hypothetical protein
LSSSVRGFLYVKPLKLGCRLYISSQGHILFLRAGFPVTHKAICVKWRIAPKRPVQK